MSAVLALAVAQIDVLSAAGFFILLIICEMNKVSPVT